MLGQPVLEFVFALSVDEAESNTADVGLEACSQYPKSGYT